MGPLNCIFAKKGGGGGGFRKSLQQLPCSATHSTYLPSQTTENGKSSTTVLCKTCATLFLGSDFSCKPNGPKHQQRAKSRQPVRVTLTLACSALKREMECQSHPGSQGGAPGAIKPHTRALHVFCMPLFPKYILTVNCAAYVS